MPQTNEKTDTECDFSVPRVRDELSHIVPHRDALQHGATFTLGPKSLLRNESNKIEKLLIQRHTCTSRSCGIRGTSEGYFVRRHVVTNHFERFSTTVMTPVFSHKLFQNCFLRFIRIIRSICFNAFDCICTNLCDVARHSFRERSLRGEEK